VTNVSLRSVEEPSTNGMRLVRWQLAAASAGAAAIHFTVISPHFEEYEPFGVFFAVVAWFQAIWAVAIAQSDREGLRVAGAIVNAALIGIWLWSRTLGLPIGPEPRVEDVGPADVLATTFEGLLVAWLVLSFGPALRSWEPTRRVIYVATVLTWSAVVALTMLVLFLGMETAGSH
jgi:hypothetical protein